MATAIGTNLPPFPGGETGITGSNVADYLELHALIQQRTVRISFAESALRGSNFKGIDDLIVDTKMELARRRDLMKALCPYDFDGVQLVPRMQKADGILYVFMASLGLNINIDNDGRKLFEKLITSIMTNCVGLPSLCLGFPRRDGIDARIRPAFKNFADTVKEEFRPDNIVEYAKDMALDVASWYEFTDGRGGFLVFVGQCATGEDWDTKLSDLTVRSIRRVVDLSCEPLQYLATPHFATNSPNKFKDMSLRSGLLLDRSRVWDFLQLSSIDEVVLNEIKAYVVGLY